MKQEMRIIAAKDTLEILKRGYYINNSGKNIDVSAGLKRAVDNTRLIKPDELNEMLANTNSSANHQTIFEVSNETTCDAVRRIVNEGEENVLCLNFASAKNPGGGFLGGALAQEECIARASGLYPCLLEAPEYYKYHRSHGTCLYSDHMIYSPGVPIIKDEDGNLLDEIVYTTIVTSPAANAGAIMNNEPQNATHIIPVMRKRIEKLLALCSYYKHETLVLGAWGCGVFQNDPEVIAQLFHEALTGSFANRFKRIIFAVKTNKEIIIGPFRNNFI